MGRAVGVDQDQVEVIDQRGTGEWILQGGSHVVPRQCDANVLAGGDHVGVDGEIVFDNIQVLQVVLDDPVGHGNAVFVSRIEDDVDGDSGVNKSPAGGVVRPGRGRHRTGPVSHTTVVGRVGISVDVAEGPAADIVVNDVGGRLDGQRPQGRGCRGGLVDICSGGVQVGGLPSFEHQGADSGDDRGGHRRSAAGAVAIRVVGDVTGGVAGGSRREDVPCSGSDDVGLDATVVGWSHAAAGRQVVLRNVPVSHDDGILHLLGE